VDVAPRYGLARVISKRGIASRSVAASWVLAGRVSVDGRVVIDPEFPVRLDQAGVRLDGQPLPEAAPTYLMLNKPRGLVTSAADEQGRDTVYRCLGDDIPWVGPVGRLDKASEGLLLMSNDPVWASGITEPDAHVPKTYRVQVRGVVDDDTLQRLRRGLLDRGEHLSAKSVQAVGGGVKNTWLEIVLAEGRNRQIRRMLSACDREVLRLMRVAVGPLQLGDLPKGAWRRLSEAEILQLSGKRRSATY
jgi:23S rRNA pseudouridine2605 synthase